MFRGPGDLDPEQIARTLAHAARAPFYARRWKGRVPRTLERLALLDKTEAAEHQEALRTPGGRPAVGVVSSASTRSGRPLRVLRGAAPAVAPAHGGGIDSIHLYSPRHGAQAAARADQLVMPATLHANTVDVLVDLLQEHAPSELVLPLSVLKWITVALEQRGVSAARFGLRVVGTTGYPLTRAARRWLEPAWRAPLVDNWSMSELSGHAHPCARCGHSHWVGAPTHFELVTPARGRPVTARSGAFGELVATTLLPHGEAMPLLRYRTGDLVEVGAPCRAHDGRRGLRFRGRAAHSLLHGDVPLVLSGDLLELGEALPDVARVPHPAEQLGLVPASDLGVPMMQVRREGRRSMLDIELRFDPRRHAGRASEVMEAVRAVVAPVVEVVLHRPGSLDLTQLARKL